MGDRANLCLNLIKDCIHGENVDNAKIFLQILISDFDKDEFKNMNIKLAQKLLDQFQFKSSSEFMNQLMIGLKELQNGNKNTT